MKKNKTAILTITAITLCRFAMLAGSKYLTDKIANGDEINNNLTAQIQQTDTGSEMDFDYPYGTPYTMQGTDLLDKYINTESITKDFLDEYVKSDINPPYELMQYQDVSNLCGTVIKYIYGYTAHSNNKALIYFTPAGTHYKRDRYTYMFVDDNVAYYFMVNPLTGKIIYIYSYSPVNLIPFSNENNAQSKEISVIEKDKLMERLSQDLMVIGYDVKDFSIRNISCSGIIGGYKNYVMDIAKSDNDDPLFFLYLADSNDNFQLAYFVNRGEA